MPTNEIKSKIEAGRAVLVGVDAGDMRDGECEISLEELRRLLDPAGGGNDGAIAPDSRRAHLYRLG